MTYIFLILVISSNTSNQQIIPMQSMAQCEAAKIALHMAEEKRSWRDVSPRINNVQCIEVTR